MNTRRTFLTAAGTTAMTLSMRHIVAEQVDDSYYKLALLSDSHIPADPFNEYRGFRPSENFVQVAKQVGDSTSQCALLCGDAARLEGKKEDYEHLKKLIEPIQSKMRVEIALGNHDDRTNFWSVFGKPERKSALDGKKHVTVADLGPQRWIVLDSLMYVDKVPGFLGAEQRDWLQKTLAADSTKPVFLMVHHTLGEGDGDLLDTDRLLSIAKQHSHVKGIVFGHSHKWNIVQKENLWWINLPAIGYNFNDEQPVGWVQAQLAARELKLTLHAVGGNRQDDNKSLSLSWSG
ncbi:MAG: metallophosphoesterase [Pirellula sp.]